ncbi:MULTISPECIES: glycosyltransferase family 2 protein [Prosthecochloris]|nr:MULTISPECIES: glycosyltransferase [Prosthecochloris]UZJ39781.1 glycosyltransferase [Prosthecochloris sp. SCSIO W1102]
MTIDRSEGTKKPVVSIITPVYNRADYLAETIESVLAQTFHNWELLIIDDGSDNDDSRRISEIYCKRDARIRYYYESHGGISAARNHGISRARGKYLALLDSDDRYLPQGLEILVHALQSAAEPVKLVYANFIKYFQAEDRFQPTRVQPPKPRPGLYLQFMVPGGNPVAPSASLAERSVIQDIGGFDSSFDGLEDRELWSRLVRKYEIAHVAQQVAIYRKHSNQITDPKNRAAKRLLNDKQAYTFFSALPLESWFPQAKEPKSQAKALDQLALALLKRSNPPVDTALYLLRLAQLKSPTRQRKIFLADLEAKIPGILREQFCCEERFNIPNV